MSGSNSYSSNNSDNNDESKTIDCEKIVVNTTLNSPNPSVISQLQINQILNLEHQTSNNSLVALTDNGQIAGSITSTQLDRLIECISEGVRFVAIVLKITGGKCDVKIKAVEE